MKKLLFILFVLILYVNTFANTKQEPPFLSSYPGAKIIYYDLKKFDEFYILKAKTNNELNSLKGLKQEKIEGQVKRIIYSLPKDVSALQAYKNYEYALKKANFLILTRIRSKNIRYFTEKFCKFPGINGFGSEDNNSHFYILAKSPDNYTYVSIYSGDGYLGRPGKVALAIIKLKQLKLGLIKAKDIKENIKNYGHIPIYGIYFDTAKAEIKKESEPTLKEIAKFLKENPSIKLYVVGHTDNTGDFNFNMQLSLKRAKAVVKYLVEKYHISKDRLKAFGVGPLAPISTNETKEGRAKNRRVELAKE